jgi:two-component system chemotaxis response regulator CheB
MPCGGPLRGGRADCQRQLGSDQRDRTPVQFAASLRGGTTVDLCSFTDMRPYDRIVVIGCSYGCVEALLRVLPEFDPLWPAAFFITLHTGQFSILPEVLQRRCALPVRHAEDREPIRRGVVFVAPPDRHLLIGPGAISLSPGPKENWTRPAIDPMFRSAAHAHRSRVVGVLLTGLLNDGANGLAVVQRCGGQTIVQDPDDAAACDMPTAALEQIAPHFVVPLREVGAAIGLCLGVVQEEATG